MVRRPVALHSLPMSSFEIFLLISPTSILYRWLSFVDLKAILALSGTSRSIRGVVRLYYDATWSISRFLRSWFRNVVEFRIALHVCDALISGSQALHFFDRTYHEASDMDIFVRLGGAAKLCQTIIQQGYKFQGPTSTYRRHPRSAVLNGKPFIPSKNPSNNIAAVYNFVRFVVDRHHVVYRKHVQIIMLCVDPIQHILFRFHSSKWFIQMLHTILKSFSRNDEFY